VILNKDLGLAAIPINQLATMISVVFPYIITADWLKCWCFKKKINWFSFEKNILLLYKMYNTKCIIQNV
jgi:hypothetical protein